MGLWGRATARDCPYGGGTFLAANCRGRARPCLVGTRLIASTGIGGRNIKTILCGCLLLEWFQLLQLGRGCNFFGGCLHLGQRMPKRGFEGCRHSSLHQRRIGERHATALLVVQHFERHFGREDRATQIEQDQHAIRIIGCLNCCKDHISRRAQNAIACPSACYNANCALCHLTCKLGDACRELGAMCHNNQSHRHACILPLVHFHLTFSRWMLYLSSREAAGASGYSTRLRVLKSERLRTISQLDVAPGSWCPMLRSPR